jgi:uncharacterized phage infection (PIP) family protein YhgE
MDFSFLYNRIRNVIIDPAKAWDIVYAEARPSKFVWFNFTLPLIILISISAFLGSWIFTHSTLNIFYPILTGLKYFVLITILNCFSAFIFREINKSLDLDNDYTVSFKIITYSLAPLSLCLIISLVFESLIFVNILSLYGIYIFLTGVKKMLNPSERKTILMLLVTILLIIGTYIFTSWLLTEITDKIYFTLFA